MKSKNNCFNCKIHLNGDLIHDEDYPTLKDISNDIGLSYNIIADISSQRKKNHAYNKFKYQPIIDIQRLNKIVKENVDSVLEF
tara:strand:+ start:6937 stop:7185 length:249 start_codon:yes stop_codon:yes gene_type:complete